MKKAIFKIRLASAILKETMFHPLRDSKVRYDFESNRIWVEIYRF